MSTCESIQPDLIEHLYRKLDPAQDARVAIHLEDCASCQQLLSEFDQVRGSLDALEQDPPQVSSPARPALVPRSAAVVAGLLVALIGTAAGFWVGRRQARSVVVREPSDELALLLASIAEGEELIRNGTPQRVLNRADDVLAQSAGTPLAQRVRTLINQARLRRAEQLYAEGHFSAALPLARSLGAKGRTLKKTLEEHGDADFLPLRMVRDGQVLALLRNYPEKSMALQVFNEEASKRIKRLSLRTELARLQIVAAADRELSFYARLAAGRLCKQLERPREAEAHLRYAADGPGKIADEARKELEQLHK